MPILMRIALRNLREHRAKTLIIGILIALGIFTLTLGNSVLATLQKTTRETFIESFTGHILVRSISDNPVTIEGVSGFDSDIVGKTVPQYSHVYEYLRSLEQVEAVTPQITGFVTIDYSDEQQSRGAFAPTFGIESQSYLDMFPGNMEMLEGRFIEPGENAIILPNSTVEDIRNKLGIDIQVGDELKVQGFAGGGRSGGASVKIRRLPLVGVYRYAAQSTESQPFAYIDATSLRALTGMVVGTADAVDIDAEDSTLLDSGEGEMFSADDLFASDAFASPEGDVEISLHDENLYGILGDLDERSQASVPDAGAWSYILLRLKNEGAIKQTIAQINEHFQQEGIPVEAVDWSVASGTSAQFNQAFGLFFTIVVLILAVVAVIIIMNTLVISVIERTQEIGTMRSLGAQKQVVRRMFIAETMSISLVFGTIGLLAGALVIFLVNKAGIPTENVIVEMIFGGDVFRPVFDPMSPVVSYIVMVGIGLISSWYPVRVALKIQPVEAMQTG